MIQESGRLPAALHLTHVEPAARLIAVPANVVQADGVVRLALPVRHQKRGSHDFSIFIWQPVFQSAGESHFAPLDIDMTARVNVTNTRNVARLFIYKALPIC